ncbi:BTAD domain-containing putative transcriptional regulator [Streptomyces sp. NPDC007088]|uniref:AfsR/SARP family transcriptional regulator n=1 Tax=Streptomyces sp. NPDC007088 TaxID=3364773 RepID=UPI00367D61F4
MDAPVRFSILGTVRVLRGDTELEPGPPKRLALLSLLLLRAPGPLTLDEAVDVLWEAGPPPSAVNVVHRHIGALRRMLEPELRGRTGARRLVRSTGGYRLLADASTSDLLRFRELRDRARGLVEAGDPARGARDLAEALRLWRAPVVAAGTRVAGHPAFTAVGHEYVTTAKEAADLVLGPAPLWAEETLTALRAAVETNPFDEALHARIIAVLAGTGRQAEALRRFEGIRRALAEELGVEPGPELLAARPRPSRRGESSPGSGTGHAARADHTERRGPVEGKEPAEHTERTDRAERREPAEHTERTRRTERTVHVDLRDQPVPPHPEDRPFRPAPSQLPSDPAAFAGRREMVERCSQLLAQDVDSGGSAVTAVICGMAGVGKTTLAVHWAHRVADHFPDGRLYVDLRGHHSSHPPRDPGEVTHEILDALGAGERETRTRAAGLGSRYRDALAGRRLLLVLDNARDCEQVRPLLPGVPGCLTVVTSRRRLDGLAVTDNARVLPLHPMSRQEGLELLERRLGARRVGAEPPAAREVVDLCGRLPLALAVAATWALTHPDFPLASLAARLRDSRDSLTPFSGHDAPTDVRTVFSCSYRLLSTGAAALFRLLSVHPAHDISAAAAASLAGTGPGATREHIAELVEHHLLVEHSPGRFSAHPLLRTYAGELSEILDEPRARAEARRRMFEHYLYTADAATALIAPRHSGTTLPPHQADVRPLRFTGPAQAAEWILAEQHILPALAEDMPRSPHAEPFRQRLTSALRMSPG